MEDRRPAEKSAPENENIIKNPSRVPVTFTLIIFSLVLVYFAVQGIIAMNRKVPEAYNIGAPDADNVSGSFTGIVLREEKVVLSDRAGYVNYYAISGERISSGAVACTIDGNGDLEKKLHELYYGQDVLTLKSKLKIQNTIRSASLTYDRTNFSTAYLSKANIKASVLQALIQDGGESVIEGITDDSYKSYLMDESGFMILWSDDLNGVTELSSVSSEDFNLDLYTELGRESGEFISSGEFLYKEASDNKFMLAFLLSDDDMSSYSGKKTLSVRMSDGNEITGDFSVEKTSDGKNAGVISFAKYGMNYMSTRFVSFQILDETVTGFKIPKTAITSKSFFAVDEKFITEGGGTTSQSGVLVKDGEETRFVPCTVYLKQDGDTKSFIIGSDTAYIYSDELKAGMTVIATAGDDETENRRTEETVLGASASIEGVYQINNGYCIFKPILRIRNSLDTSYVIIEAKMRYGLQSYDRILLDASKGEENEIVFE